MGKTINIIAAVAEDGAIGKNNALLWHIKEDLQYFKQVTLGSPVIMGRKTFESIGRPLPKRQNIVVSRSMAASASIPEGITVASSLEQALQLARPSAQEPDNVFVLGGGEIYRQAMTLAHRLYITEVHTAVADADTFFPAVDPALWEETSRSPLRTDPESGLQYSFVVYGRK